MLKMKRIDVLIMYINIYGVLINNILILGIRGFIYIINRPPPFIKYKNTHFV